MGLVYSKLMCEQIVTTNVNDRFVFEDSTTAGLICTITPGRYRDMHQFAAQIASDMNTESAANGGTNWFSSIVSNSTGVVTIAAVSPFGELNDFDFDSANYGTELRNALGHTSDTPSITSNASGDFMIAPNQHEGSFYPSEPIESDTRPDEDGQDLWTSDAFQQETRTGMLATKGGDTTVDTRSITFLLPQADLTPLSNFLKIAGQGRSFAFYHDRDVAWDGASNEYDEYKIRIADDSGVRYEPEQVDPANKIWHRFSLSMQKRVAPTV